jgi:hypothetical protein
VVLDAKTDRLTDYALQNDLNFSRFTELTCTENKENNFAYSL